MSPDPNSLESAFRRRRGAPRGNKNALKHGFYAHQFKPADIKDLEKTQYSGLIDEIAMLRVQARRVIELSGQAENLQEAAFTLRVLCLATLSINRLIRTQFIIGAQSDPMQDALAVALQQVTGELGLDSDGPKSSGKPPAPQPN